MNIFSIHEILLTSLTYFLVFVIFICFVIYYRVYFLQVRQWKHSNVPFLQATFLIGHKYFLAMTKYSYTVVFDRVHKENKDKDLVGLFFGTIPIILVRDPKLVHQIFVQNFNRTFKTGFNMPESEVEAQYISPCSNNRSVWRSTRTTMLPMFSTLRMEGSRFDAVKKQIGKLWSYAKEADLSGQPISLQEVSRNFVLDSISLREFGEESDSYKKKEVLFDMIDRFFEASLHRMITIYVMMQFPSFQVFKPLKFLSHQSCVQMAELLQRKIKQRDELNINEDDFIDFLRSLRNKNVFEKERKDFDCLQNHEGYTFTLSTV